MTWTKEFRYTHVIRLDNKMNYENINEKMKVIRIKPFEFSLGSADWDNSISLLGENVASDDSPLQ